MNLDSLIEAALQEDIGSGDHTSLATLDNELTGSASMLVKAEGVIAGLRVAAMTFAKVDNSLLCETLIEDGSHVAPGDVVMQVTGKQVSILSSERVALNFVQQMSGIASLTNLFVKELEDTSTRLLDTRKTTPGWRELEKEAVRLGGGTNHRLGLHDMILIKDNHIDYCGGIVEAVKRTRKYLKSNDLDLRIEVETRNLGEVTEALEAKADRIMLDNFSLAALRKAVALIGHNAETEASGGIRLNNIKAVAQTGVDFVSVGALTHSAKALDVSLEAQ